MANKELTIDVRVHDYTSSPGPRYSSQGEYSGEDFYHTVLNQKFVEAYNAKTKIIVNLDGVDGYASSFLDEAFGNLVYDFSDKVVRNILTIVSTEEPEWESMIMSDTLNEWQKRRKENKSPRETVPHTPWWRLVDGNLVKTSSTTKQ